MGLILLFQNELINTFKISVLISNMESIARHNPYIFRNFGVPINF